MFRCITPLMIGLLAAATATTALASPDSSLERAFAQADLNHDGLVTRAEFVSSRAARFRQLDRNHDGYLSRDDAPAALSLLYPNAARLTQMLNQFDTDHDGRLSLKEFIAGSLSLFDEADAGHKGVLTMAEATAAAARLKPTLHSNQ